MNEDWPGLLRLARAEVGLTQRRLGELAGVSAETVRAYERGARTPRRKHLLAILGALNVDSAKRRAILEGAGFAAPATLFPSDSHPRYFFSVDELQDEVELAPWPEFVLSNANELVAANTVVQALWGIDFEHERAERSGPRLNLLSVASQRRFADRMLNWDECVATLVGASKGRPLTPASIDEPDPYFNKVLEEFAAGDPAFLKRLVEVWTSTPPREPKVRWSYRVVWQDADFGVMRFHALVGTASEPDGLSFNDWMPIDAESWNVLEQVKRRTDPPRPSRSETSIRRR